MLVQIQKSDPPAVPPAFHRFATEHGEHLFVVNGSRVYSVSADVAADLDAASESQFERLGLAAPAYITAEPLTDPPVRSLSLAIAQKCNLACTYCYAEQGNFGQPERDMSAEVAFAAVDLLFRDAAPGERFNLAFLGGEPLTNRALLQACTLRASELAASKGARVGFSITTNGTLLSPEDGVFFERLGFAVTVSLDGAGAAHDSLRPFKGGQGSYVRVLKNVEPLVHMQRRMQVSARVTVTPRNLDLRATLDAFLDMGFHSVGFSPMLSSPAGRDEMTKANLASMLNQMIDCGREFERRVLHGERYAFSNMATALQEIHKGTHRPYPCGAGAGYFGVSAEGGLYACHRFVEDEAGLMGSVQGGVDRARQNRWLAERNVHQQEPCRSCWARYLCGGGCHYEVIHRGRPACDYIRGWLHYCLQAYIRILEGSPRHGIPLFQ